MAKIQLKITVDELAAALRDWNERGINLREWWEDTNDIYQICDEMGLNLYVSLWSNEYDSTVRVSYPSDKIGHTIILDGDAYQECKTYEELARLLLDWHNEGRKLESKLPNLRHA